MRRVLVLAALLFAAHATAQVIVVQKGAVEKNGGTPANLVDYTTSQTAGTVLEAPCSGASGPPTFAAPCLQAWGAFYSGMTLNKMVCIDDLFYRSGASYMCGVSMVNQGTGASNASGSTLGANHPGQIQLNVGTSATSSVALQQGTSQNQMFFGGGVAQFWTSFKLSVLSGAGETYTAFSGYGDADYSSAGPVAESVDAVYFRYTDTVNGGRWQGVARNNSTESSCDTTIAASTSLTDFYINVNAGGTSVGFFINGGTGGTYTVANCSVTTNIPITSPRTFSLLPIALNRIAAVSTNPNVTIDYYAYIYDFTSAR